MKGHKLIEYRPSGKFDLISLFYWGVSLGLSVVGAFCYAWLLNLINYPLVSPIFFVLFVVYLSWLIRLVIVRGNIRSSGLSFSLGVLIGLCALYWSWLFLLDTTTPFQFLTPHELVEMLSAELTQNEKQVFNLSLSAKVLSIFWFFEALSIVLIPGLYGFYLQHTYSFCESCNDWLERQGGIVAFYHEDSSKLVSEFLLGSTGFMEEAEAIFNTPIRNYYLLDAEVCASCNDFFTLRLVQMNKESDLDKTRPHQLTAKLIVSRPIYQRFSLLSPQFPIPEDNV